nr:hypothetical protein [Bowdeniella nasicola]
MFAFTQRWLRNRVAGMLCFRRWPRRSASTPEPPLPPHASSVRTALLADVRETIPAIAVPHSIGRLPANSRSISATVAAVPLGEALGVAVGVGVIVGDGVGEVVVVVGDAVGGVEGVQAERTPTPHSARKVRREL